MTPTPPRHITPTTPDPPPAFEAAYTATVNGLTVRWYGAGHGDAPPVVLLHGGGIDSATLSWGPLVPHLRDVRPVLALDWPGYGGSPMPPDGVLYTSELLQQVLGGMMDDVWRLDKATLVGLSMGGGAALTYALAQPERVEKLVLVDSYGLQDSAPFHPLARLLLNLPPQFSDLAWRVAGEFPLLLRLGLMAIFYDPRRVDAALMHEARSSVQLPAFYAWLADEVLPSGMKSSHTRRLHELGVPTLIVHGRHDRSIPLVWAQRAAEVIPQASLEVLEQCGHWPTRERPDDLAAAIVRFLANERTPSLTDSV